MAPPGTPPAILAKIEADIGRVAAMPDVRKKRDGAGLDMLVMSSGDMMRLIRADAEKYGKAAKLAGIKAEWAGPPAQPPGPPVCAVQRATLAARQSARIPARLAALCGAGHLRSVRSQCHHPGERQTQALLTAMTTATLGFYMAICARI